ncbi:MAG: ROK family protein [Bacteroidales bacterium]|nr:ROK family protein [Bacteroidales bacterium]
MDFSNDKRVVLTLDGGGTNFVFSAIQGNREIVKPLTYPSNGHDLPLCLETIINGFREISQQLDTKPEAISFAFPGPTDYPNGIIGDLENLPAFRGGVALGPMLEEVFQVPVFINNDGDLFAYGEAISGFLPMVNQMLRKAGSTRQYKNLIGITLGTGFGAGLVRNKELILGDNGAAGEIWVVRSKLHPHSFSEECVSIRAVKRVYGEHCPDCAAQELTPKDIFEIASGQRTGHQNAAREAFRQLGESIGEALASALTLFDGLVVIGGGLANAWPLFLPETIRELNGTIEKLDGRKIGRLEISAFNLEDQNETQQFIAGKVSRIKVPFSEKTILYDAMKRTGIGISKLGTSKAVAVGAYAFALNEVDKNQAK